MTIQITIIGLGQIGASIGLALEEHKKSILRIGHDKNMATAKTAEKMGAVDQVKRNLPNSVQGADIIILALPFGEIHETLEYIKEDLKEDVVIVDTAPNKVFTSKWMEKAGRTYVGLAPAINPLYLGEEHRGVESAHVDLFHKAVTMIAAPASVSSAVLQLVIDFVELIGSKPLFADIAEVDGVLASAHLLPQLTATALLTTTVDAPGWDEAKKVAGQAYANSTVSSQNHAGDASLSADTLLNNPNISRLLGVMIASLQKIQKDVDNRDGDALDEFLNSATKGRDNWLNERNSAEWIVAGGKSEDVEVAGVFERFFGFKKRK